MRHTFPRPLSLVLGLTLALGALVGLPAPASAKTSDPCCGNHLWIGKQRTSPPNTQPPVPGQVYTISGYLTTQKNDNLRRVGTFSAVHTVTSVNADGSYEVHQTTVYKLAKGTITTGGSETWPPEALAFDPADTTETVPITGGTGIYAGVTGTATSYKFGRGGFNVRFLFLNPKR
jgi:hypothetical protein